MRLCVVLVALLLGCDRNPPARPRLERCPSVGCGAPVGLRPREFECRELVHAFAPSTQAPPEAPSPFWLALCARADRAALACGREAVLYGDRSADAAVNPRFVEACLVEKWLRAALREGLDDVVRAAWVRGELPGRSDEVYRVSPAITGLPAEIVMFAVDNWRGQSLRFYVTTVGHCAVHLEGVMCSDAAIDEAHLIRPNADELERARRAPWLRRDAERGALRWLDLPTRGLLSTCTIPVAGVAPPPSRFLIYDRIDARCAFASRTR